MTTATRAIKKQETKWYWTGIIGFVIGMLNLTCINSLALQTLTITTSFYLNAKLLGYFKTNLHMGNLHMCTTKFLPLYTCSM